MSSEEVGAALFILFALLMAAAPWLPAFIYFEIYDLFHKNKNI